MKTVYDFVSPYIEKTESLQLDFSGIIGYNRRIMCNICQQHKYNLLSEPVLVLELSDYPTNTNIDLSRILDKISFEVGGTPFDSLHMDQINIYQHKYNIKPSLIGNTLIVPLPFNLMLKSNGYILPSGWHDARFFIEVSDYEFNKHIVGGHLIINYSKLNDNINLDKMTDYFYNQMLKVKSRKDSLLTINGSHPSDYISYYLLNNLIGLNNDYYPNIYLKQTNQIVPISKNTNKDTSNNTNTPNNNKSNSIIAPICLIGITQNQFTGLESFEPKNGSIRFRLAFNHDVTSLYICTKSNHDILNSKWFDNFKLQVNGQDKLEFSYELLKHYSLNENLPDGVLTIPHVNTINFEEQHVIIALSGVKLNMYDDSVFSMCVESSNWITVGPQSYIVFKN